jgi:Xaa-Pro aminopeptidase
MSKFEIDIAACRARQKRLLDYMTEQGVDVAIVNQAEQIQWLTGIKLPWVFRLAAALFADGHVVLAVPERVEVAGAVDQGVTFEAKWHSTLRNDQGAESARVLLQTIRSKSAPRRVGCEFSTAGQHLLGQLDAEFVDLEPTMYRLRRRKDDYELKLLNKAIAGTERMYRRAREIIRPGVSELEVFNELQAAAVNEFGEMLTGTGNDYQCCSRGGPPRDGRTANPGELYILDLGPAFQGYFADNCRTIAVTEPSDIQLEAWSRVVRVFEHVEQTVKPGKSARELFQEAQQILDEAPVGVFNHHLGHGIGLFPHETPHLNPHWDDYFEEGDVFTAEPGLYAPELKAGIRLENDYLVTGHGVELLTTFPLELVV